MRLLKTADRTLSVLGLILFGGGLICSLFSTVYFARTYEEVPYLKGDIFPLVLLICGLAVTAMYRVSQWLLRKEEGQEKRIRLLLLFVLLYTLAFGVIWVYLAKCIPVGDQASVCKAAEGFRNGDYSMLTRDSYEKYLFIHPHQLGLTALIELIYLIFGNGNFQAFQYLNCLGLVLCAYSGYRITGCLTENKRAKVYYLFMEIMCFPLFFYVTYVYGEIPSITFSMLAIWSFLEYRKAKEAKRKYAWLVLCCITCMLACLIRNNSLILLIAFVCILLLSAWSRKRLRPVLAAALLVSVFFCGRFALRTVYEQRAGIELNAGAPMLLYVAMGMQEGGGAPGWSNGYILHAYWGESEFDGEMAAAMAVQDIKSSVDRFVSEPAMAARFFGEKFLSQWNDPSYQCFAMTHINGAARGPIANSMFDGKLHMLMTWCMNQYQSLLFLGAFLWFLLNFWRKKEPEEFILFIVIFGGFLFHMIWEAKGRYILPYFVMMIPMAAVGLEEISQRVYCWLKRNQKTDREKIKRKTG